MKKIFYIFIFLVICAPILFYLYLQNGLVCAFRAVISSIIFGLVPLLFLSLGMVTQKILLYYICIGMFVVEMIITPIIMLNRLGWEKFYNERLLAFFTFEGIALIELFLVVLILHKFRKSV